MYNSKGDIKSLVLSLFEASKEEHSMSTFFIYEDSKAIQSMLVKLSIID